MNDGMGFAKTQIKVRALDCPTKAYSKDFKLLDESFADTNQEVVDKTAEGSVQSTHVAKLAGALDGNFFLVLFDCESFGKIKGKSSLWPFSDDIESVDLKGNLIDNGDGFESYS